MSRRSVRSELRKDLAGDLFAGLTLWAVFAAQALAYARLAHATPTAGLVTAIAGAGLYTALGSSRRIPRLAPRAGSPPWSGRQSPAPRPQVLRTPLPR